MIPCGTCPCCLSYSAKIAELERDVRDVIAARAALSPADKTTGDE